jgi:hypothetical protein
MARDAVLMITLGAIVILNLIAIVLLNNQLAEEELAQVPQVEQPRQIVQLPPPLPVRTLLLQNRNTCPDCYSIEHYVGELNDSIPLQAEFVPEEQQSLFASPRLPAIAFNATFAQYDLLEGWYSVGYNITIPDGPYAGLWYVLPTLNAPYVETNTSRVRGRVVVTFITYEACSECYDVMTVRKYLNASRITPYREVSVDAASSLGKSLLRQYNISTVPTILMDAEAAQYPNLMPGWNIVGTIESDGTFVLRDLTRLNVTYYDLAHKKLMKP